MELEGSNICIRHACCGAALLSTILGTISRNAEYTEEEEKEKERMSLKLQQTDDFARNKYIIARVVSCRKKRKKIGKTARAIV